MTEESFLWIALVVSLTIDLLFAAIKAALTHARLPYLLNLREKQEERVDRTIKVIERPRLRTTLRLAMLMSHFFSVGLLIFIIQYYLPETNNLWLYVIFLLLGIIICGVIEFAIEGIILKDPENAAIRLAFYGRLLDFVFTPFSMLMTTLLGSNASAVRFATITDEGLRHWVEIGQQEGSLEKGEREMIYSIFRFGDTLAREIMVPRIDLLALDINATIGEARNAFMQTGHSRVPVYEDTIDNVVGLLHAKDLLGSVDDSVNIVLQREILRTAYFVPEAKKVDELLTEMQSRGVHMTLVVDEYGGVAGVVTLEDIVEEIVGEIRDEYDQMEEQLYQLINKDEYIFLGRVDLEDFNEIMGMDIATDNADTLGGFIYGEMGHVPNAGESIIANGVEFTIEEVVGRRILKIRARSLNPAAEEREKSRAD
ncbi:MAG: hemolysin family protein [Chloroflexota bacterium]